MIILLYLFDLCITFDILRLKRITPCLGGLFMNTSHGWIKLYRCLLEDAVCQKSAYFHLWVTLLLMAAHTHREFIFNNRIQKLYPGQLITGRKKLSTLTGIPEMTIEHILKLLVNSGKVQQQKNNKFRIITITKW